MSTAELWKAEDVELWKAKDVERWRSCWGPSLRCWKLQTFFASCLAWPSPSASALRPELLEELHGLLIPLTFLASCVAGPSAPRYLQALAASSGMHQME